MDAWVSSGRNTWAGGPDGGNGGRGGDVILQADENISDLRAFHKKHWKARQGTGGAAAKMEKR